jgi:hypothetical protein
VPIAATFPLDAIRAAFALLEQGHTRGKIVLLPERFASGNANVHRS